MSGKTFTGTGKTLDLAIAAAHDQILPTPNTADEIIKSKVVAFGKNTGGLIGADEFYAVVERA